MKKIIILRVYGGEVAHEEISLDGFLAVVFQVSDNESNNISVEFDKQETDGIVVRGYPPLIILPHTSNTISIAAKHNRHLTIKD
jgi:hypothetical protein